MNSLSEFYSVDKTGNDVIKYTLYYKGIRYDRFQYTNYTIWYRFNLIPENKKIRKDFKMILKVGQFGIKDIINIHTDSKRDKIIVSRYIHTEHCYLKNVSIVYGHEKIICNTPEDANKLFQIMDDVFNGTREEKLTRILKED